MFQKSLSSNLRILTLLLCFILSSIPLPASADSFVVNTSDDLDDGTCDSAHCSLREAIQAANGNPGADTIGFSALDASSVEIRIDLLSPLPALQDDGTSLDATTVQGYAGEPKVIVVKAAGSMEIGFDIQSNNNLIRGFSLAGYFLQTGQQYPPPEDYVGGAIVVTGAGNIIQDNVVGWPTWPNSVGVRLGGAGNSVVGNVISTNGVGLYLAAPGQTIQGNKIGTDRLGNTALGNTWGIYDEASSSGGHLIGGPGSGQGNIISASREAGLRLESAGNVVQSNRVGTNAAGSAALANKVGIGLFNATSNIIGGASLGEGNLISGNVLYGIIVIGNAQGTRILGNKIGSDSSGTQALPNETGVELFGSNVTIGGLGAGEGNLIFGNPRNGIWISSEAHNHEVLGNVITQNGANNNSGGIRASLVSTPGQRISQNSIFQNGGLGIVSGGPIALPSPHNFSAFLSSLSGVACSNCLVELFHVDPDPSGAGEGKTFISSLTADGNGDFTTSTSGLGLCKSLTATAIDADNRTSEFSQNFRVNCIRLRPPLLYITWVGIILGCAGVAVAIRRVNASVPARVVSYSAVGGALLFLALLFTLPFVEVEFIPRTTCGDGVVNGIEQCDGDDLSLCRSDQECRDCRCVKVIEAPVCGDGYVDGEEQCDGDDLSLCLSGQVCDDCRCITMLGACGNGEIDEGEQCDGDDLSFCLSGQVCENCRCITMLEMCGNGQIDEGEQCDGDDLSFCTSGQGCESCQCVTYLEAEPESKRCVYTARVNANCRESDYPESAQMEILMQSEMAELLALSPEYTYGLFELENQAQCWMWLGLMDGPENPFGTCNVGIVDPPAAHSESACQSDLDEVSCLAAGGQWVVGIAPSCLCPED